MAEPVYRRVVIKISGEFLAGTQAFGIDQTTVDRIAGDLIAARQLGAEVAVVVGGGNIVRGVEVSSRGVSRPTGDTMGMLATVMNCLALEAAIERRGMPARSLSAFVMPQICELFTRGATHKYLAEGRIVLLGGAAMLTTALVQPSIAGVLVSIMIYVFGMAFVFPNATASAMEPMPRMAGVASSLLGSSQMAVGSLAGYLVNSFYDRTPLAMASGIAGAALLACLSYLLLIHRSGQARTS